MKTNNRQGSKTKEHAKGNKIVKKTSKKSNKKKQLDYVQFDETRRKDFLTGFHKRKVERKKNAEKLRQDFIQKERLILRKQKMEKLKDEAKEIEEQVLYMARRISKADRTRFSDSGSSDEGEEMQTEEAEKEKEVESLSVGSNSVSAMITTKKKKTSSGKSVHQFETNSHLVTVTTVSELDSDMRWAGLASSSK